MLALFPLFFNFFSAKLNNACLVPLKIVLSIISSHELKMDLLLIFLSGKQSPYSHNNAFFLGPVGLKKQIKSKVTYI